MGWLVWSGAAFAAAGLAGVIYTVALVLRARGAALPDAELRARMQRAVTLNLAALAVSMLGLVLVIVGVILS